MCCPVLTLIGPIVGYKDGFQQALRAGGGKGEPSEHIRTYILHNTCSLTDFDEEVCFPCLFASDDEFWWLTVNIQAKW